MSRSARAHRHPILAVALAALVLDAADARAQVVAPAAASLPRLVVRRGEGTNECPDATSLAAAVAKLMKRSAVEPVESSAGAPPDAGSPPVAAGVPGIVIEISRDGGYVATIRTGERTRQISDPGPTCAGLADALALTLAILLDADYPSPPPPALPPAPSPTTTPPVGPDRGGAEEAQEPPAVMPVFSLEVGGGGSAGLVRVAPVLYADLDIRPWAGAGSFSLGVGAFWIPSQSIDFSPGSVDVWLAAASLRECLSVFGAARRVRVSVCGLFPSFGAVHGEGHGYQPDRSVTKAWIAAGLAGGIMGPIVGPLGWSLGGVAFVPLGRESFEVDGIGIAYEPWAVGLMLRGGIQVAVW